MVISRASKFIPAADEVWRLQTGTDPESQIFQAMADGGHYQAAGGTRQGIYVVSPSGRLLASANALDPMATLALMEKGLAAWNKLPQAERQLDSRARDKVNPRWEDFFPERGLTLRVTLRDLPRNGDPTAKRKPPANRDHAWFTRAEVREFLPKRLEVGQRSELPRELFERLACLHLVDAVYGQTLPFAPDEIRAGSLECEVVERRDQTVQVAFEGSVKMVADGPWLLGENDWTPDREYPRSATLDLIGNAIYNTDSLAFTHFELIATGLRRGGTQFNGRAGAEDEGAIGFVFQPTLDSPSARVPPAFIDLYQQFGADWVRGI